MRLIDADKLVSDMYHNAFEIDTNLQKWDSGCWIRYKMFEKVLDKQPTAEAIPIEFIKEIIKLAERVKAIKYAEHLKLLLEDWEVEKNEKI